MEENTTEEETPKELKRYPVMEELERRLGVITQGNPNTMAFEHLMGAALLLLAEKKGGVMEVKQVSPDHDDFDPVAMLQEFHDKFKLSNETGELDDEEWELRHARLEEEFSEYCEATGEDNDDAAILDALVDLVYIALGTCQLRKWDFKAAFTRVHEANMKKERAEHGDQSKFGSTYDIIKPEGWEAPDLTDLVQPAE